MTSGHTATDYALSTTGGSAKYRGVWRFYCLEIGINNFLHQLSVVLSSRRQGELRYPARAFHARIREHELKLDILVALLLLSGLGHLVPTLLLIVRHGKFANESVAEMVGSKRGKKALRAAERRYERHRKHLLEIICVGEVHMDK